MIKNWLLSKGLQGRVIFFVKDDAELIPINDITVDGDLIFCHYDPRDVEERMDDLDE